MTKDMFGKQEPTGDWVSQAKPGTSPLSKAITDLNKSTEIVKGLYDRIPWNPKPGGGGHESFHTGTKRTLNEGNTKGTAARAALTARSRSERRSEPKGFENQQAMRGLKHLTKSVKDLTGIIKAMTAGSSDTTGINLMHAVADGAKPVDEALHGKEYYKKKEREAGGGKPVISYKTTADNKKKVIVS